MSHCLFAPNSFRRALSQRRGAVAVEFAILALPFIFLLFAIIEIGLLFVTNINLNNATLQLARQIRTGGIVAQGASVTTSTGTSLSLSDFKNAVCKNLSLVPSATCATQLQIDIRSPDNFGTASSNPVSGNTFSNSSFCYYSGSGGSIVEFRAFYLWPVVTPILLSALVNTTTYKAGNTTFQGNYFVMQSAEAFRVERNFSGTNSGTKC